MKFLSILDHQVVFIHFSQYKSLNAIGIHANIESLLLFNQFLFIKLNDFNFQSYFSILFIK
jgi:hypothetical protein